MPNQDPMNERQEWKDRFYKHVQELNHQHPSTNGETEGSYFGFKMSRKPTEDSVEEWFSSVDWKHVEAFIEQEIIAAEKRGYQQGHDDCADDYGDGPSS